MHLPFRIAAAAAAMVLAACGTAREPAPAVPPPAAALPDTAAAADTVRAAAAEPTSPLLPAVPPADGPLEIRVVYPTAGSTIDARDSSFLFGSVGNGAASLTINGHHVPVWPNGAWLAWIPLPDSSPLRFDIVATTATDTARLLHEAVRAAGFTPPPGRLAWIDTTSFEPRGRVWWPRDEYLPLRVRAAPGATLRLRLADGTIVPLAAAPEPAPVPWGIRAFDRDTLNLRPALQSDRYSGAIRGRPIGQAPGPLLGMPPADTARAAAGRPAQLPPRDTLSPTLEVIVGTDTARARWPLRLALIDTLPPVVRFDDDTLRRGGTDSITIGRAVPGGTYNWFFPTGTRAAVTGRVGNDLRVRLSQQLSAWVPAGDAVPLASRALAPATVGSVTMTPLADRVLVRVPVSARVPFEVRAERARLTLHLHGARGDVNWLRYGAADPLVELAQWRQTAADQVALEVDLTEPVWGWRTRWSGDDLILEIRRTPDIAARRPLAGRVIAVDAGHPPLGATGPTGLREPEANLAVALRLRALLEDAGARVVMIRDRDTAIDLLPRIRMAEAANAEVLVSIHNNALPDGVNPFTNNGTSVYFNQVPSAPLARAVQAELVSRLGLADLGIGRGDLALVRHTWMPSVLTEGLFMMLPDQEAALRTPEVQQRYAEAVAAGLEAFLRGRARSTD